MAGTRILRQDDFTGGLNLRADQFQLAQNESPKMLNVEIDPRGGVFSRGGMRRINTTAVVPLSVWTPKVLAPFYGAQPYLMLGTGAGAFPGNVFYSTGSNFSGLSIAVTSAQGPGFAPWGETLYIATGKGSASYKWSGAAASTLLANGTAAWQNSYTTPVGGYFPKADFAVTHAGKVFVASTVEDGTTYANRIRWSHPNSPENWAEQDRIDINDGGTNITGLAVYGGHLLVFKRNAVFAIFGYDSDTFQVVEVSRTVGAANQNAISVTERGVYFFSYPDGLMFYNGERIADLFEPIRPAITLGFVNPAAVDSVRVNTVNRRVWVSVPYSEVGAATNPTVSFVYDPSVSQRGAWLMFQTADQLGVAAGCSFINSSGTPLHVVAHPTQPYVLRVDQYNYATDNITGTEYQFVSRYRSRWLDAGNYSQKKMFRRPDFIVKQQSAAGQLVVKVYGDYEEAENGEIRQYNVDVPAASTGMIWGIGQWGVASWGAANSGSQVLNGRSIGLARSVQLEFTGPAGNAWGINSYTLKYNPRRITA